MTAFEDVKNLLELLTVDELSKVSRLIQDKLYHVAERPSLIPNQSEKVLWEEGRKFDAIRSYRARTEVIDLTFVKNVFEKCLGK